MDERIHTHNRCEDYGACSLFVVLWTVILHDERDGSHFDGVFAHELGDSLFSWKIQDSSAAAGSLYLSVPVIYCLPFEVVCAGRTHVVLSNGWVILLPPYPP